MDVDPRLFENVVSDSEVRKIVLSYLFHNCFKETAETFIACSGMKRTADCSVNMDKRKRVESTSLVEEDLYADWKLGWHEGHASNQSLVDFSLLEKLVQRAKCEDVVDATELEHDLVSLPTAKEDMYLSNSVKGSSKGAAASGRSFPIFRMDKKGKSFYSCHLDASAFPSEQYQLSFDCVGMDTKNKPWILLPSRILPSRILPSVTLKITPSGAT